MLDLGVQPEIRDEPATGEEPVGVPDRGDERRRTDHVDARYGHQPPDLWPAQCLLGDQPLDRRDLRLEELDVTQPGVHGLALLQRQLQARQPVPALDPEQVSARRLGLQPALQRGMDLVLGASSGPD
jgi:hypothetical protein